MCQPNSGQSPRGNPRQSLENLRQPGPLAWKIRRIIANETFKIVHRQPCCGNGGEPGC